MYKANIIDIKKERHQARDLDFLEIEFDIVDENNNILEKKIIGMKKDTEKEEIENEIKKHIEEYKRQEENRKLDIEKKEEERRLQINKDDLIGKTIKTN